MRTSQEEQYQVYLRATQNISHAPEPFVGQPVFHLGAHLWPIEHHWEHHVDKWNRLAETITGRCIVGVAECTDCGTVPTSEVIARLHSRFEVFTVPNSVEGENPTFRRLLELMPRGNDDVFLYCHGKGVKPLPRKSPSVARWVDLMYRTVIFNHRKIEQKFAEGYQIFGSFRVFGSYPYAPRYKWHYAGTFFAIRSKYLQGTSGVRRYYGGVEAWPGNNFPARKAWVEFGDNRHILSHYEPAWMLSKEMDQEIQAWTEQHEKEGLDNERNPHRGGRDPAVNLPSVENRTQRTIGSTCG